MKSSPQPKVLRAYLCTADEAEDTEIVFAATNGAARFPYAQRLDWDFRDVRVRRAPEYDAYAPGPVPVSVMLDHGWRFECFECYRMLSLDMDFVENMSPDDLKHWAKSNAPHVAALEEFDAANPEPAGAPDSCTPQERWAAENKQREWRARRERLSIKIIPPALSRRPHAADTDGDRSTCKHHDQKADDGNRVGIALCVARHLHRHLTPILECEAFERNHLANDFPDFCDAFLSGSSQHTAGRVPDAPFLDLRCCFCHSDLLILNDGCKAIGVVRLTSVTADKAAQHRDPLPGAIITHVASCDLLADQGASHHALPVHN